MKIKVPPYPNLKITEEAFNRDVIPNTVDKTDSEGLSNHLLCIIQSKTGEKRVFNIRPVKHNENTYITTFPNPIHLFLSLSSEHYNISEKVKSESFVKCGKPYGKDLYLLNFEENGTHECYNNYIKYRTSSIIMLVSSLEAFLNHIIPNDIIYKTVRKNKPVEFTKIDIESQKISFREKLEKILPQCSETKFNWKNYKLEFEIIIDLYKCRKDLIHLKTNSQTDFDMYFEVIDKMMNLNISCAIDSTITIMNIVKNDFIETE